MYVLVKNGSVKKFPYSFSDLQKDNPAVSFPFPMSDQDYAEHGMYPVVASDLPKFSVDREKIIPSDPLFDGNKWVRGWQIVPLTPEERDALLLDQWSTVRGKRDELLRSSDWTQLLDAPISEEASASWRSYRQALRDITKSRSPFNLEWPTPPAS